MVSIISKLKNFRKLFTWHIFPQPKDKPIQSLYEITWFLGILIIFFWVYLKCNKVPFCSESFEIECLNNKYSGIKGGYIIPYVDLKIRIPYSDIDTLRRKDAFFADTVSPSPFNYIKMYISYENFIANANQKLEDYFREDSILRKRWGDFIRNNEICDSLFKSADLKKLTSIQYENILKNNKIEKFNICANRNYREMFADKIKATALYSKFDSICNVLNIKSDNVTTLFYYRMKESVRNKNNYEYYKIKKRLSGDKSIWLNSDANELFGEKSKNIFLGRSEENGNEIIQEGYSSSPSFIRVMNDHRKLAIDDPGWFTLDDISQAYYNIQLKSETLDSINIKIDFVGATDFSEMIPEPDEKGMNYIYFSDKAKIRKIKENGLFFHAKFKELENRQNVRMFFLTSVMGGLVITIIVFLVLAFYKVFTKSSQVNTIDAENEMMKHQRKQTNRHLSKISRNLMAKKSKKW